jgi:hypothetical protein
MFLGCQLQEHRLEVRSNRRQLEDVEAVFGEDAGDHRWIEPGALVGAADAQ